MKYKNLDRLASSLLWVITLCPFLTEVGNIFTNDNTHLNLTKKYTWLQSFN